MWILGRWMQDGWTGEQDGRACRFAKRLAVRGGLPRRAARRLPGCLRSPASLHLTAVRPLSFRWLKLLLRLKSFALVNSAASVDSAGSSSDDAGGEAEAAGALPLEKLSHCSIHSGDRGLGWLWRPCGRLEWLQLRSCDGTGDACLSGFCFFFLKFLKNL